ncbi:hypothetical protein [Inhella sp.]|uniref:hypothetical protein n=1 Tax=Inhella sp. TaxID=1921806 RepID=UPI0035B4C1B3
MIIWGRKTVRTPLGYAADFCPICASAQAFEITRVGSAGHLYYISVGEGELVGYERRCLSCGIDLRAEPTGYAALAPTPLPLAALRKTTCPDLDEAYRAHLDQEDRIRFDPLGLPPQDRQALILQPFVLLAPKVTARFQTTSIDLKGRFIHQEVLPVLVRALRRLRPNAQELAQALHRMVQLKEVIGSKIKLQDLMKALAAASAGTPLGLEADATAPRLRLGMSAGSVKPMRNAALLLRVSGYLLGALAAALLLARFGEGSREVGGASLLLMLGSAGAAWGLVMAGRAVAAGRRWGRGAGVLGALLTLGAFPIGTVVGLYLLWALLARWPADAE